MADSPEFKAFQEVYVTMKNALDPASVAPSAFSRDLLTSNEKAAATNKMHTEGERMEELLKAIERRIIADPQTFQTFVDVLRDEPAFANVLEKLQGAYIRMKDRKSSGGVSPRPAVSASGQPPTKKALMQYLYHEVPHLWKEIGTYLEIKAAVLSTIEARNLKDPQRCLMELIDVWLARTDPAPRWGDMAEAVDFVGRGDVAQGIRSKYHC